ncbi:MAG: hypothetical protein WA491_04380 [Candidatus Acidiferrum sp.]
MKKQSNPRTPAQALRNALYLQRPAIHSITLTLSGGEYDALVHYTDTRFGVNVKPTTCATALLMTVLSERLLEESYKP